MEVKEAIMRIKDFGLYHAIEDLPKSALTVEAFNKAIELLVLEDNGRLVELPCSVGDIVWCTTSDQYDYISEPIECLVNEISSNIDNKNIIIFRIDSISSTDGWAYAFPNVTISNHMNIRHIEDFGKSVFLNREEAEEKLKLKEMK